MRLLVAEGLARLEAEGLGLEAHRLPTRHPDPAAGRGFQHGKVEVTCVSREREASPHECLSDLELVIIHVLTVRAPARNQDR